MNSPVALLSAFIFLSAVFVVHANQPFCEQAKELGANTCKLFGSDSKECHILQESQRAKCAGEAKSPQLESVDALLDVGVDTTPTPTPTAAGDATTAAAPTPTPTAATTTATTTATTQGGAQDGSGASQDWVCGAWDGTELNDYTVWMTNTTQNNVCLVDSDGAAKNCKTEDDVNNPQVADGKIVGFGFELTHAQALPTNVNCTGKKHHCMIYTKMGKNEAVQWTVAGSTANVKLTYLKYSVCKTSCKNKGGQCDCSHYQCAVRKVLYKCTCVSDASGTCKANEPCPWDTNIEHETFPLMYT